MPSREVTENDGRIQYTASSGQTVFAYDFLIFDEDDITVIQNGITLTLTSDYTISGIGNQNGGNITLVSGATAGDLITIFRDTVIKRESQYQADGQFDAEPLERDLDRITVILQELDRDLSRSIVLNPEDSTTGIELPKLQADRLLSVNNTADNFELIAFSEITTISPDTSISGETSGDLLQYNGSLWVNTKTLTGNYTFSGVVDVTNVNAATSAGGSLRTAGGTNCLSWGGGGSANLTAGGNLSMGTTHKIVNCADPSSAQDVATKAYVDAEIAAIPVGPFSEEFESAEQTITSGGSLTIAHGLSGTPKLTQTLLRCKTADAGYAVGDEIDMAAINSSSNALIQWGWSTYFSGSNVKVSFGNSGIVVPNASGGSRTTITNSSWRLIIRAWA